MKEDKEGRCCLVGKSISIKNHVFKFVLWLTPSILCLCVERQKTVMLVLQGTLSWLNIDYETQSSTGVIFFAVTYSAQTK